MRVLCLLLLAMAGCQFHQAKDTASLSGVVTSTDGPEAGVWVIAETADLWAFLAFHTGLQPPQDAVSASR